MQELVIALGYQAHGYISELEAGKKILTVELAITVAHFFGVSLDYRLLEELELPGPPD